MNTPQKAFEAGIKAIVRDGRGYREARKDVQRVLDVAAPLIAAQALRDAATLVDVEGQAVDYEETNYGAGRRHAADELEALADELDPQ